MTRDELIELVARAVCKSRTCEGYACCQWPAQMGRADCPVRDHKYDDAAEAALSALSDAGLVVVPREMTDEMATACRNALRREGLVPAYTDEPKGVAKAFQPPLLHYMLKRAWPDVISAYENAQDVREKG